MKTIQVNLSIENEAHLQRIAAAADLDLEALIIDACNWILEKRTEDRLKARSAEIRAARAESHRSLV